MEPTKQLNVLARIWGNDREGYVFLPWIPWEADTVAKRKKSWHEGPAYYWPRDREKIMEHLSGHEKDDVYFTPNLFNTERRLEIYAEPERTLWADLDEADPRKIDHTYRPTIAWESSPGRYQAVWLMSKPLVGASWPGKENHRLTTYLGADPSGWDTTQVLRVPGRRNVKPGYRENGQGVQGQLLWDNGPRYVWSDFDDIPEIPSVNIETMELLDEDLLNSIDRHKVWAKVRLKVPQRIREYMASKSTDGADRSEVLWQIERELANIGCSLAEIVVLVRGTVWNKYVGRNNEIHMLKVEASKALALAAESPVESLDEEKPEIRWLSSIIAAGIPRPRWLVRNVWARGSCGFIAGDPKSYKSWLGLDLAVSVATGEPFIGDEHYSVLGGSQPVLVLQEEDDLRLVVNRLAQIVEARMPSAFWHGQLTVNGREIVWTGPDRELPIALHVSTGFTASDESWQAWLDTTLQEGQFSMVLIDTLGTVAGDVDTDRSFEMMSKILVPLKVLAKKYDVAIALVHHNKKESLPGQRAGKSMLGSVALHAWVESALYVKKTGNQSLVIESETKQAPGHTIRIDIPTMGVIGDERTLWHPTKGSEETADGQQESADGITRERPSSGVRRPTGGRDIAFKMRQIGGLTKPLTIDYLQKVLDISPSALRKQLNAGVKNGYLATSDRGYTVIE